MKELLRKHQRPLSYVFWGVITTAVNYGAYFLLTHLFNVHYLISNVVAWFVSVLFAFGTNKAFVFRSHKWNARTLLPEFGMFLAARVFSGFLETGLLWVGVDLHNWNSALVKITASIAVVAINYIVSNLLIFRNRRP